MINIISLGVGVQSVTLFLMACHNELKPRPKCAVFADPKWERYQTYATLGWLQTLGDIYGIPIFVVSDGNIRTDILDHSTRSLSPPLFIKTKDGNLSLMRRQCTLEYKIRPIQKLIKERFGASAKNPVSTWIGISLDEMQRMKPSDRKYQVYRYPLIEKRMSRVDCYYWLHDHNYPIPVSSSCIGCPYHSPSEWRKLSNTEFQEAVDWEKSIQSTYTDNGHPFSRSFLTRYLEPLETRPFESDHEQISFEFETKDTLCDEGGCFL